MKQKVAMDDIMPLIQEQLMRNGRVAFSPAGISMRPMLESGRDTVYLERITPEQLHKWDVILYRTSGGQYVLHRLIKKTETGFIARGDNHFYPDSPQPFDTLIGRVYRFERSGKPYLVQSFSYRCYVWFWMLSYIPRKGIHCIACRCRKLLKHN